MMNFLVRIATVVAAVAAVTFPAMAHPGHSTMVVDAHTHAVDPALMVFGLGAVLVAVGLWMLRRRSH